jgi:hypothetical protein
VTDRDRCAIIEWIKLICREQRRTDDGQTFLHLTVDDQTHRDIGFRPSDITRVLE